MIMPNNILDLINNQSLISSNSRFNELRNNFTEEQRKQINYQLVCSAMEKAIIEIYAEYPNSNVTNALKEKLMEYLSEIAVIIDR
tara:strand:- start:78 stop:332 length:255 start_codon:yes stop_codon:yes gene_type:complete